MSNKQDHTARPSARHRTRRRPRSSRTTRRRRAAAAAIRRAARRRRDVDETIAKAQHGRVNVTPGQGDRDGRPALLAPPVSRRRSGSAGRSSRPGPATPMRTTSSAFRSRPSARPRKPSTELEARDQDQRPGAKLSRQSWRNPAPGRRARGGGEGARSGGQARSEQRPGAEQPRHHPVRAEALQEGGRILPPRARDPSRHARGAEQSRQCAAH